MKLVLSRKGFDSGYGGYPSFIMPKGELISLPIPDFNRAITYNDLFMTCGTSYSELMSDIIGDTIRYEHNGKFNIQEIGCHFDPDINSKAYERKDGWRPLFGQAGSALSHLRNQGVGVGDIFLFFGWFRDVVMSEEGYCYSPRDKIGKHLIYGYFQVGEIHQINQMAPEDWMTYHAHVSRGKAAGDNDCVYVAAESLSFEPSLPGAGSFSYGDELVLTKEGLTRTRWQLPDIFRQTKISYHSENSWKDGYFQSAAKGQEFVVDCTEDIERWVKKLVTTNGVKSL